MIGDLLGNPGMYREEDSDGASLPESISEGIERRIRDIPAETLTGKVLEVFRIIGEYVPVDQRPKCLPTDYEVLMLPSGAMLSIYYWVNREHATNGVKFYYLSAPNVDRSDLQSAMAVMGWKLTKDPIPFGEERDKTKMHLFFIEGELDSQSGSVKTVENFDQLGHLKALLNYLKDSEK